MGGDYVRPNELRAVADLLDLELAGVDDELERKVAGASAGAAGAGRTLGDVDRSLGEGLVDVANVIDQLVWRVVAFAVEEDAVAFDVRELPAAAVAAKDRVQKILGDFFAVLDGNAVEERRVAADIGEDERAFSRHAPRLYDLRFGATYARR